jgi:predicted RNase H-like HicB family nuclease
MVVPVVFYPAIIERGRCGYGVSFPDLPGCTSAGETVAARREGAEGSKRSERHT